MHPRARRGPTTSNTKKRRPPMNPHLDPTRPHRRLPAGRVAASLSVVLMLGALVEAAPAAAGGPSYDTWATAQKIDDVGGNHADLNSASSDGCPIQAPDGLNLYMATNRPGGHGGLDLWVATRQHRHDPWGP